MNHSLLEFDVFEQVHNQNCIFDEESYILLSHQDFVSSEVAVVALSSVCFPNLDIHNDINASHIVFKINDLDVEFLNTLSIEGQAADVSIISNRKLFFNNVSTTNVKSLSIHSEEYLGIDPATDKLIFGDLYEETTYINSISTTILSTKVNKLVMLNDVKVWDLNIEVLSKNASDYALIAGLDSLFGNYLHILDNSNGLGSKIYGKINLLNGMTFSGLNNLEFSEMATFLSNGDILIKTASDFKNHGLLSGSAKCAIESQAFNNLGSIKCGAGVALGATHILSGNDSIIESNLNIVLNGLHGVDLHSGFKIISQESSVSILGEWIHQNNGEVYAKVDVNQTAVGRHKDGWSIVLQVDSKIFSKEGNIVLNGLHGVDLHSGFKIISQESSVSILGEWIHQHNGEIYAKLDVNQTAVGKQQGWSIALQVDSKIFSKEGNIVLNGLHGVDLYSGFKIISEESSVSILGEWIHQNNGEVYAKLDVNQTAVGKHQDGWSIVFQVDSKIVSDGTINIDTGHNVIIVEKAVVKSTNIIMNIDRLENFGFLIAGQSLFISVKGNIVNHNLIKASILKVQVQNGNFDTNGLIEISEFASWEANGLNFNNGSITTVGSFLFAGLNGAAMKHATLFGATFKALDPDGENKLIVDEFSLKGSGYKRSADILDKTDTFRYDYVCGSHRAGALGQGRKVDDYCRASTQAHGYHNEHSLDIPSIFQTNGNIDITSNKITIYLSSLIADKIISLHKNAEINLISESSKKWVNSNSNYGKDILSVFNLVNPTLKNYVYTQILHTYNSIFHGREIIGDIGNLAAIGITHGDEVPKLNGHPSNVVAVSSSYNNLVSKLDDIGAISTMQGVGVQDSKHIVLETYGVDGSIIRSIFTKDFFTTGYSFDASLLMNLKDLNPKIFEYNPMPENGLVLAAGQQFYLHPLIRVLPALLEHIDAPSIDVAQFLEDLAFHEEGPIPMAMDGHYLDKLITDAEFILLGKFYSIEGVALVKKLAMNAVYLHTIGDIDVKPGESLPARRWSVPFIWPEWVPCPAFNLEKCLTFKLYMDQSTANSALDSGSVFSAESAFLDIKGNLVMDMVSNIKIANDMSFKIGGGAMIAGSIKAGTMDLDVAGNFINVGTIETISTLTVKALNVALAGITRSGASLSVEAVNQVVLQSLYYYSRSCSGNSASATSFITQASQTIADAAAEIIAGSHLSIIGAKLEGAHVHLVSGDNFAVVPIALYHEASSWGRNYYHSYKSLKQYRSSITATNELVIEAGSGALLRAVDFKGGNATILTNSTLVIDSAHEYEEIIHYTKKKRGGIAGAFGGTKSTYSSSYISNPIKSALELGGNLLVEALGGQVWIGADVTAYSVNLISGSPEREAQIALLPSYAKREVHVITKKTGFNIKVDDGFKVTVKSRFREGDVSTHVIPTIFQVGDGFIGYSINGEWMQLSSSVTAKNHVIINARNIELTAAPNLKFTYAVLDEAGFGTGFSDKEGEFAVKAGVYKKIDKKYSAEAIHVERSEIISNFVHLNASDTIKTLGAIMQAERMEMYGRIIYHGILKDTLSETEKNELMEAGIKLGIKSNIGSIANSAKAIGDADYSRPEGIINAAFAVSQLSTQVLTLLSPAAGHGITGGIWFYGQYSKSETQSDISMAVPTVISVSDMLQSESEKLRMIGTQVESYRAYIKTKYLLAEAAVNEASAKFSNMEFDVEIPLTQSTSISPNLNAAIAKGTQYQRVIMNVNIHVHDALQLEVQGHADMRGAFISAKSLDAFFESLILESLQDIVESKSWSANLGLSLESVKNLKGVNGYSIGGSDARHSKHVVERLSGLLGEEEARVVVAGALHLNGAMIAAAQRDENGKYNDHGNLVLKVGELFWQHIYDYDNGHTLGMSYSKSFGKKAESEGQAEGEDVWHLGVGVDGHDKEGVTKATIGLGDVTIGESKEVPEGINRDVNFVQEMQTNYDVQPIKPHFTNQDIQTLIDGLKRREDGSFDLSGTISSIGEKAYDTVAVPLSEAANYLFPEEKQQLNDEDYGTRLVKAAGLLQNEDMKQDSEDTKEDKEADEDVYDSAFVNPYLEMLTYASFSKETESKKESDDEYIMRKIIMPLEAVEDRKNKIYLDSRGIPTVGVGSALIVYTKNNDGKPWKLLTDKTLKEKNIHLSSQERDVLYKIQELLNDGVSGKVIKNIHEHNVKNFKFTMRNSDIDQVRDKDVKDHLNVAKRTFKSDWDKFTKDQKVPIVMYTFHHGNAVALKKAYDKGGEEALHNVMKSSDGNRGDVQARFFDKGVFCSDRKYCVMPGDTGSSIAKKVSDNIGRHVSEDSLKKLNPQISNFDKIYAGQELNIPQPDDKGV